MSQLLFLLLWCHSEISLALVYSQSCTNGGVRGVNGKHFALSFGKSSCFHQTSVEFDLEGMARLWGREALKGAELHQCPGLTQHPPTQRLCALRFVQGART